jgi:hypothetical protein
MGGGNSHQRAVQKASNKKSGTQTPQNRANNSPVPLSESSTKHARERWTALAGAILLTVALPIAIDQGYFRYNAYALPCLGLAAVILYAGFIGTSKSFLRIATRVLQWRPIAGPSLCIGLLALVSGVVGAGFWFALQASKKHVASELGRDTQTQAAHRLTGYMQFSGLVPMHDYSTIAVEKIIGFNLSLTNHGPDPVQKMTWASGIAVIGVRGTNPMAIVPELRKRTDKLFESARQRGEQGISLGVGQNVYRTELTDPLTDKDVREILGGTFRIVVYARSKWKDSEGFDGEMESCEWLQRPTRQLEHQYLAWHTCPQ